MQLTKTFAFLTLSLLAACGSRSNVVVDGNEVRLSTTQLDITFARQDAVNETYMIFGGVDMDRPDSPNKIHFTGLGMTDARAIYDEYPDFTMCGSGGAGMAKDAIVQLSMVPANGEVLEVLQDALAQHNRNLQVGGGRVCIAVTGAVLTWQSAQHAGEEVLHQLPKVAVRDLVLVESARIEPAATALASP